MTQPVEKRRYTVEEYWELERRSGETVTNPRIIVEVLASSTEAFDRGEKFARYREIESFEEYVLVSQATPRIEVFLRQAARSWAFTAFSGMDAVAKLQSVQI